MHHTLTFSFRRMALVMIFTMAACSAFGQDWMVGYNYRKSIDLHKGRVPGTGNLVDFPVLITFTDPDLRYLAGQCVANKISSSKGLDISFALGSAPAEPISFQLERFDPVTGTLTCWVRIPSLSAAGSVSDNTMVYLYYGSNTVHDPYAPGSVSTWAAVPFRRWHMNPDVNPASSLNVKSKLPGGLLVGSSTMTAANFVPGKVGTAVQLNGTSEFLSAAIDTSRNFTISFWVRFDRVDQEQVILSNDSTGRGGYTVSIDASGKLVFVTKFGSIPYTRTASSAMLPNVWYFVSVIVDGKRRGIYTNGKTSSVGTTTQAIGQGGAVVVGRSKQRNKYFKGRIDELSIEVGIRSAEWMESEYNNQNDPSQFYTVGNEQQNEIIVATGFIFNGTLNELWNEAGNWNLMTVPEPYANVTVKAGMHVKLPDVGDVMIGQLTIDSAGSLSVMNRLDVVCSTTIVSGGLLLIKGNARLQLSGNLMNNGRITSLDSQGTLTFSGHSAELNVSGTGDIRVFRLQNDLVASNGVLNIQQPLVVTGILNARAGVLNSAGNVRLAATKDRAAFLSAIENLAGAAITGAVLVEKYVTGDFPAPATARGWRLWSSPVYTATVGGTEMYHLAALKASLFITGKGAVPGGFDSSPQNGNTIYTHDQAIVGTLSQKYVAIPVMATEVALGKGIYAYSRGSRLVPDAFRDQVQVAPFPNPAPYTISYNGELFVGTLKVDLHSRNHGEPGDGFNLLGNPYASPIRWGSLQKENLGSFAWMFNPVNASYDVTDDPALIIPAAEGFFVKVNSGAATGSLTFNEQSKVSEELLTADEPSGQFDEESSAIEVIPSALSQVSSATPAVQMSTATAVVSQEVRRKLEVTLSAGIFSQKYVLKLHKASSDATTDEDAVNVGDGYVNVAGLGVNEEKLAIDSRELVNDEKPVRIFVKVWSSGRYLLAFSGLSTFLPEFSVVLLDNLLKTTTPLTAAATTYSFDVDLNVPKSQGTNRFTILIKPVPIPATDKLREDPIRIYPNPFTDVLNLKALKKFPGKVNVSIRDLLGQSVLTTTFNAVSEILTLNTSTLKSGLYIIEIIDGQSNTRIQTAKIVKP